MADKIVEMYIDRKKSIKSIKADRISNLNIIFVYVDVRPIMALSLYWFNANTNHKNAVN